MPTMPSKRPPWVGFLIGLLAIALPLGGYLLWKTAGRKPPPHSTATRSPLSRTAPGAPSNDPGSMDETGLIPSGASVEDPTPPPNEAVLRGACARSRRWLAAHRIDPFAGVGTDSLRLFALEVECWDRLAAAEPAGVERSRLEDEVRGRLRRVCDARRLRERIGVQGSAAGALECLLLAARCRQHEVDPAPLLQAVDACRPQLDREIGRLPSSMAMLYAAAMERAGASPPAPSASYRSAGVLAARPREVTMREGSIAALTAEIFAATDGGRVQLSGLAPEERTYLERVLPYFAMATTLLRREETAADLLTCMLASGMTGTYGYREGLRRLVERQNPDGSFGEPLVPGRPARLAECLAPTTAAVTAITLERRRTGAAG